MRHSKVWTSVILVWLLAASTVLTGCANDRVVLHPIMAEDIQPMDKDKPFTPKKDGWFLSSMYLSDVLKAKVDK